MAHSRLAQLIARKEGFGVPGTIPTTHHNPGDLRHSPHSVHSPGAPNGIGAIPNDLLGWEDLERQLRLYAVRGLTLRQMIVDKYAPKSENDSEAYLAFVCSGGGWTPDTLVADALSQPPAGDVEAIRP